MITIPLFEAMAAIGGRVNRPVSPADYIHSVVYDSREVREGTLFVALKGQRADGHDFICEAEKKGAVAAVVEHEVAGIHIPQLIVPSVVWALGDLARIWRGRLNIPVVAVTGSVGKTSTKELIAYVLEAKFNTHKSRENFNNEIGLPAELMNLNERHECSVVEFGMRNLNQINYLSRIARPNISVITNIGMSHIEILGSRENIAKAKAEIQEGMDSEGILILNRDDDFYDYIKSQTHCRVISFGTNHDADIRISDVRLNENANPSFKLNGFSMEMKNSVGKHLASNAAAAYAVAVQMGIEAEDIASRFATFGALDRHGSFARSANGALLLDNTYNAAPDSIQSSLHTLSELAGNGKRTVAVIGEMLELGAYSEEAHRHIGKIIVEINSPDLLVTVGKNAILIGEEAHRKNWKHFEDAVAAAKYLSGEITGNDIILLQGSNGVRLDLVAEEFKEKFVHLQPILN
ncbi:MAG: UDP-N-acetylmuramoyl-tripeptide--D-alanyl-D-alanine ligase [Dysgonamonadaceae bacterium]|jgi:UDP-N-acetylmuramoyl-tripeptide--D-alanyl-D-alanine ligase|nr:UDP-N-acetylmuramoyl-tripeptide--D-alanyl-D-alanine ligase [Dysgonamonadaceae bacterium]